MTVDFKPGTILERGTFRKLNDVTSLQIVSSNLESINFSAFMGLKNLYELNIWDTNITGEKTVVVAVVVVVVFVVKGTL